MPPIRMAGVLNLLVTWLIVVFILVLLVMPVFTVRVCLLVVRTRLMIGLYVPLLRLSIVMVTLLLVSSRVMVVLTF